MKPLIILIFALSVTASNLQAQASDFLVLKKNGRVVKNLFKGSHAQFGTVAGAYAGVITQILNDSIHLTQFDIRQMPTNLGVYVLDTVGVYNLKFGFREILYLGKKKRSGFNWLGSGRTMLGGGLLTTVVGLGSWIFNAPNTQGGASPLLVGASAAIAGTGYLIMRSTTQPLKIGGKYRLEYIKTGK